MALAPQMWEAARSYLTDAAKTESAKMVFEEQSWEGIAESSRMAWTIAAAYAIQAVLKEQQVAGQS